VIDRLRALLKRRQLDLRAVSLSELVDEVALLTRADSANRHVGIEIDVPRDLPLVRGDRIHLQQVLLNLLISGMDALAEVTGGGRSLTVRARRDGDGLVEVTVSDNGPGIPADELGHLFEPFFTTKAQGMGLGLPISKTIIDAHGGKLWAEKKRGARSDVSIHAADRERRRSVKPVFFIVDDDASYLAATTRMLRASGFAVQPFPAARELLAPLGADTAGCVIADLQMPEMNGLDLQAALARTRNAMPVIFLAGHGDIPSTVRAMRDGAEDFLEKRAPKEMLLAAVRRALARDERERAGRSKKREVQALFDLLTEREHEVLTHVLRGALNKQIAAELGICERTVKLHRTSITTKLGVQSVAELARLAQEHPPFDCLVLDVQLGGISGVELQRRLVASGERTPIIFIAAHDEPETREQALAAGCTGYFRKTDSGTDVIDAIRRAAA